MLGEAGGMLDAVRHRDKHSKSWSSVIARRCRNDTDGWYMIREQKNYIQILTKNVGIVRP